MGITDSVSLSSRISRSVFLRYSLGAAAALIAAALCAGLEPLTGNAGCYLLLLLAVAFCSWYCGVGASTVAVVIGIAGVFFRFVPKIHALRSPNSQDMAGLVIFVLASGIVILMGESRRRQNRALLKAHTALEEKVRARTADLAAVNRSLRELSARLMKLQDDERRRIARELHDSVGQTLAALAMNLSLVRGDLERLANMTAALNDSENLVREMSTEVRTISHLLHPPLLDEAGLSSALRWYVNGFSQRSGIKVDLDLSEDFIRLPAEIETAIFRVVQECLTNIHRHSGSSVARIRVHYHDGQVLAQIEDNGRGISPEKLEEMGASGTPGVGIRGMRERLRQLGGNMEIESSESGTLVKVQVPAEESSSTEGESIVDPAAA